MPANAAAWYMAKRKYYADQPPDLQGRKLLSCSHKSRVGSTCYPGLRLVVLSSAAELAQLAVLASDWLFTLLQPIRSQLFCRRIFTLTTIHKFLSQLLPFLLKKYPAKFFVTKSQVAPCSSVVFYYQNLGTLYSYLILLLL